MKSKKEKRPNILVSISDIHIEDGNASRLANELFNHEKGFLCKVKEVIDLCKEEKIKFMGVTITGDMFHKILSNNGPGAKLASDLVNALINIVVLSEDAHLIILKGTHGHDYSQLNVFKSLMKNYPGKIFIIDEVCTLNINNYDILCIPEQYMTNQDEFYAEYFSKKYDIIFHHGFFDFNCFSKNEKEKSMPNMPIFKSEQFLKMARLTISGHDHERKSYKDQIHYNGSFSTHCFADHQKKGFLTHYIDADETVTEFVENELAPVFKTFQIHEIMKREFEDVDFEYVVKRIKAVYKKYDYLRIKIPTEFISMHPGMLEMLREYFVQEGKKLVLEGSGVVLKDGESVIEFSDDDEGIVEADNSESSFVEKYQFLLDEEIPLTEKIMEFIKKKHGKKIEDIDLDDEFINYSINVEK